MEKSDKTSQARFQFTGYLIDHCSINLTGKPLGDEMEFGIDPTGEFDKEQKLFTLTMLVAVSDKERNLDLSLRIRGFFNYEATDMNELRTFIGISAPALLFPYIRAYVSNITALSGMQPIIMPTLNMVAVGEELVSQLDLS